MNKKHLRGVLSLLLTLAMLLSLFAGLSLTAGAANNYAYNSGARGTACTSLSSAAQSYWTGTYSFTNLNAKTGDTLRSALRAKITSNRSTVGYDGLKTYMPYTDAYQGSSSRITLYYSNYVGNSTWNGTNWNREHVWPDSLGGNAMEGDLHSMRPTDPQANSTRGNSKYANVRELYPHSYKTAKTSATNGSVTAGYYYSNSYFEPLDHAKGDAARILLYDYVVTGSMTSPTVAIKDIQTLLDWCALDPVDEFEMQRNDIVQTIEGCRNPFIDYPELAWRLYSSYTMPSGMVTPSSGSAYVVSASTNNSNYGTVSVNGYIITAIPAEGYYASSYTILSGTPTVTQNGNTFTVAPTSNCSIRINFAAKHAVTVTLSANGSTTTQSGYAGEVMSLPTATAPTGYGFVGWVTSAVAETSTMPETIYSGTYTPTAGITLYALYSHSGSGSGSGYTLVGADNFTEGTYLIGALRSSSATDNFYFATGSTNSGDMVVTSNSVTAAESGGVRTVTTPPSGAVAFYFTGNNTNGFTIAPATNATNYLGIAADANRNLAFGSAYSTTKWRVVAKNNALLTNGVYLSCASGTTYNVFENSTGTNAIRGYKTGEYRAIYLFKQGGSGTITYMTSISNASCAHTNTTNAAAVAATCTQGGYTAGVYCNDCGTYVSGHTATAALGHNYGSFSSNNNGTHSKTCSRCSDVVTANCTYTTSTSGTTTTFTCTVCNYSYTSTASTYTITYNDCGATSTATVAQGGSVTLPATASTVSGYTFAGWVAAAIPTETTAAPTIRTGSYTPTGNVTLYACYTPSAAGSGSASLVRMTAGNTLSDGDRIVIVADGTDVALYQEAVSNSYVNKYTFDSSAATVLADEKNYLTVNVNSDGFTLGDATNGYLNSSNNYLYCNSTEQTWTLSELGDGTFKLQSDGRNLSYRSDLSSQYWRMGGTNYGTSGNTVLRLYKLTGGTTTYYTTAPTASEPTTYTVTYNDRGSTTTATCTAGSSVSLPAAASTVSGYTFAGWVAAAIGTETTTAPTVLTGSYTPGGNVTLYACYTRSEGSGGSAGYALASGALAAGDQVIVALKSGDDYYALPNANSGGVAGKAGIALTVTNGIATADSAYTFVIYESSGHLALKSSEAANYIGLNSSGKISCNGWGDTKYLIFTEVGGGLYTITSETNAGRGLVVDGTSFKANDGSADNVYIFKYTAGGASTTYYTTNPTAAGLKIVSAAPVLNGKIDMTYTVSVPSGYTNPRMAFTFNGVSTTVSTYTTDNGNLKFAFTGINPQCMGDAITATLYATKNGATQSVSVANYSVKEYCVNKLADNTISSSLRKLLSDLLAYGAAAQTYMNYKTNALVTSGVTGTSYSAFATLTGNAASFNGTADANTYWISAGLTLTDSVAMTFRFYTTSVSDLIVYVTLGGRTETYTSFTSVGNGVYEISFTGISAEQFGNTVRAVFERDEEEVGNELSYSVNAYVQSKQNDSNANLKALVRALYNYGVSAAAYAG